MSSDACCSATSCPACWSALRSARTADRRPFEYPFGTLAVNLSGSLVLGLLVGLAPSHHAMTLLGTATLGSYTTFSTWMLETLRPAEDGQARLAWMNIALSLALGLAA